LFDSRAIFRTLDLGRAIMAHEPLLGDVVLYLEHRAQRPIMTTEGTRR
jgi:hypothetical protein